MARTPQHSPGLSRLDGDAEALKQLPHSSVAIVARIRCSRFGKLPQCFQLRKWNRGALDLLKLVP